MPTGHRIPFPGIPILLKEGTLQKAKGILIVVIAGKRARPSSNFLFSAMKVGHHQREIRWRVFAFSSLKMRG
jgi:hypothetical protein